MNIYYCHGFASRFDPGSSKLELLSELGPVYGHDMDYTQPADEVVHQCIDKLIGADIDIVVGTSMGGWLASVVGSRTGIPFVAINPAITPSQTLMKHVGKGVDYQGNEYELTASAVKSYGSLPKDGCGLILLDEGDDVIDWRETYSTYHERFSVVSFPGGSHRFDHMEAALPLIQNFFDRSSLVYGLGED
ncbi:YqiA/YcfP family alpha/beta fold hydrolase [Marinobacter changyiensis]|uniref:YqiA/YcfP family alpha/beta fold hydrolase n=1 Tax=Marinobacter changyiensis TaxID=2604091 RepID=UPI0012657ECC|nr:YqiA/YcfP family alpha/beta fold hydrolase [Marinobacter changyiensis]